VRGKSIIVPRMRPALKDFGSNAEGKSIATPRPDPAAAKLPFRMAGPDICI
jgi:hypothetical protein